MKLIEKMCLASLAGLFAASGEVTAGADALRLRAATEGVPPMNSPIGAQGEGEVGGNTKSAPTAASATKLSDSAITMKVREQLLAAGLRSGRIRVSTENGIVHLDGKVPSDSEKLTALNAVRAVEGVQSVVGWLGGREIAIAGIRAHPSQEKRPADAGMGRRGRNRLQDHADLPTRG